jgi:NADH-quinone oxidoreductase subunit C
MDTLEQIKERLALEFPQAQLAIIPNESLGNPPSLLVDRAHGFEIARFLRDAPGWRFDYLSNATGVDFLAATLKEKIKVKKVVDGVEKEVDEVRETKRPAYLEAVYHLYSMELKHGPVVLRMRTEDRDQNVHLPSLTPLWRGAEFQEREIYDLYGIIFDGHPDLRRILMWDGFKDYPMRRDYVEPDDYEYEPTPHDEVLTKMKEHYGISATGAKPA